MQDLVIKFPPITKLNLYREIKKVVFQLLDKGKITAERGNEIHVFIKKKLSTINSQQEIRNFYKRMGNKYPELTSIKLKIERKEQEEIHEELARLVKNVMEKGNLELAERIMEEIEEMERGKEKTIEALAKKFPEEFSIST